MEHALSLLYAALLGQEWHREHTGGMRVLLLAPCLQQRIHVRFAASCGHKPHSMQLFARPTMLLSSSSVQLPPLSPPNSCHLHTHSQTHEQYNESMDLCCLDRLA